MYIVHQDVGVIKRENGVSWWPTLRCPTIWQGALEDSKSCRTVECRVRENSRNVEVLFWRMIPSPWMSRAVAASLLLLLLLLQVTLQQYSMQPKAMLSGANARSAASSRLETDNWKSGEQPNVVGNWITVSAPTVKPVAHFWVSFRVDPLTQSLQFSHNIRVRVHMRCQNQQPSHTNKAQHQRLTRTSMRQRRKRRRQKSSRRTEGHLTSSHGTTRPPPLTLIKCRCLSLWSIRTRLIRAWMIARSLLILPLFPVYHMHTHYEVTAD